MNNTLCVRDSVDVGPIYYIIKLRMYYYYYIIQPIHSD